MRDTTQLQLLKGCINQQNKKICGLLVIPLRVTKGHLAAMETVGPNVNKLFHDGITHLDGATDQFVIR